MGHAPGIRLISPRLFQSVRGYSLQPLTQRSIHQMHTAIAVMVGAVLEKVGGPSLRPIEAAVLDKEGFRDELAKCAPPGGVESINFDHYNAFGYPKMRRGSLYWKMFYNMDAFRNTLDQHEECASDIILHEISGTLYGHILERIFLSEGCRDSADPHAGLDKMTDLGIGFSAASEGWACLFSQKPLDAGLLLQMEQALLLVNEGDPLMGPLKQLIQDRHAFTALALLKTEAAHGFQRLVELMHKPPGLIEEGDSVQIGDTIRAFWEAYAVANARLGMPTLPWNLVSAPVDLLRDSDFMLEP